MIGCAERLRARPAVHRPPGGSHDPVLAAALRAYIAWSALIISSSLVWPSSGKLTTPTEIDGWIDGAGDVDRELGDPDPDLLGEDVGAGRIRLGQEHDELVAAVAGRRVDLAGRPTRITSPTPPQDAVAEVVAVPVVDRLELVEIHHQQAEAAARPGAPGDLAVDRGEEERPVEEARSAGRPSTAGSPRRARGAARGR